MPKILVKGYSTDEIPALSNEALKAIVLRDEPLVFKVGSANLLGKFKMENKTLILELAHVDGGDEGALPTLAALASRYALRENLEYIEWRVHAVHCAEPNLKLRRVLERKSFSIRNIQGVGECYWSKQAVDFI